MANDKEEKGGSGSSNKLLIIILIVVLVAVIGVGVFVALMLGKNSEPASGSSPAEAASAAPVAMAPLAVKPSFYKLDPFVLSLQGVKRSRFLQIKMTIMSRREGASDVLDAYQPWIRNIVVKYLSGFSVEQALKPDATDIFRRDLLAQINALLDEERTGAEMDDILITDMVIQ